LRILGHEIENGNIRPDPQRLQPLRDLPLPSDAKALRRVLGLFAYYSQWIFNYSHKIRPLIDTKTFPVSSEAKAAFEQIKTDIENSAVRAVDENLPFELETDASDVAIAAEDLSRSSLEPCKALRSATPPLRKKRKRSSKPSDIGSIT
ncbi:Retrovirus-related Pol polyprotein from transposon 17.6, partial [Trichinella sp. T8]